MDAFFVGTVVGLCAGLVIAWADRILFCPILERSPERCRKERYFRAARAAEEKARRDADTWGEM